MLWKTKKRKIPNREFRKGVLRELLKKQQEFQELKEKLDKWLVGDTQTVEESHNSLFTGYSMAWQNLDYSAFGTGFNKGDVYDSLAYATAQKSPLWREAIKKIPSLAGQIIGGHTIIWGHKISFKKSVEEIKSKYGDKLDEIQHMRCECSCGWKEEDVIPFITPKIRVGWDQFGDPTYNVRPLGPDFQMLEELILKHVNGTFEEVSYSCFTQGWLEDSPEGFINHFVNLLQTSDAILNFDFNSRSYLLIDDKMNEAAIKELVEMFAGYEIGEKKVRVLRNV